VFFRPKKKFTEQNEDPDTFIERIREKTKGNDYKFGDKDIKVEVVTAISQLDTQEVRLLTGLFDAYEEFKAEVAKIK